MGINNVSKQKENSLEVIMHVEVLICQSAQDAGADRRFAGFEVASSKTSFPDPARSPTVQAGTVERVGRM
jgi:hypothetical protein